MVQWNYNLNIPAAANNPSVDQPDMQTNTNSISNLINVDHIGFNLPNGGFHSVIHMESASDLVSNPPSNNPPALPTPVPSFGELISVQTTIGGNSDEVLFYQGGGGRFIQLTSILTAGAGNQAKASAFGYTVLPGGIIMQWGTITGGSGNFPLLFITNNVNFPNACFNVQLTPISPIATTGTNYFFAANGLSSTGFNMQVGSAYKNTSTWQWVAIGN